MGLASAEARDFRTEILSMACTGLVADNLEGGGRSVSK